MDPEVGTVSISLAQGFKSFQSQKPFWRPRSQWYSTLARYNYLGVLFNKSNVEVFPTGISIQCIEDKAMAWLFLKNSSCAYIFHPCWEPLSLYYLRWENMKLKRLTVLSHHWLKGQFEDQSQISWLSPRLLSPTPSERQIIACVWDRTQCNMVYEILDRETIGLE